MDEPAIEIRLVDGPVGWLAAPAVGGLGGGECVFLGRTRAETHGEFGDLHCLRYEAYGPMAERGLGDLGRRAIDECGALFVRVHHSLGDVGIGEASVLVQVVCAHRREAFKACRMIIDQLKVDVPIWKREIWVGGETWSEPRRPAGVGREGRGGLHEE